MGRCQLEVALDGAPEEAYPRTFRAGERLSGAVIVRVDEPVRCDGLDLELRFMREDHHGEGGGTDPSPCHDREQPQRLFSGEWPAGEHRYPFTLRAPSRPSYDGAKVSFRWEAHVRADIPWAGDPVAVERFVVAAPIGRHEDLTYEPLEPEVSGGESMKKMLKRYAFPALTVPALGLVLGILPQIAAGVDPPNMLVGALGAVLAAALLARSFVRARKNAERGAVGLEARILRSAPDYRSDARGPEEPILDVMVDDPPGLEVEQVEVTFGVFEQTARIERGDTGATSHWPLRTELWKEERRLEPSAVYHVELPLPAPGTAPPSTGRDAHGRGVYWLLEARVVRRGGAEEWARREIHVTPAPPADE